MGFLVVAVDFSGAEVAWEGTSPSEERCRYPGGGLREGAGEGQEGVRPRRGGMSGRAQDNWIWRLLALSRTGCTFEACSTVMGDFLLKGNSTNCRLELKL